MNQAINMKTRMPVLYYCSGCEELKEASEIEVRSEPDVDWSELFCPECNSSGCIDVADMSWVMGMVWYQSKRETSRAKRAEWEAADAVLTEFMDTLA